MRGEQGVGPVSLNQPAGGDLLLPPTVIGPAGELQNPQGHRNGETVGGELTHERVEPFPGKFAREK